MSISSLHRLLQIRTQIFFKDSIKKESWLKITTDRQTKNPTNIINAKVCVCMCVYLLPFHTQTAERICMKLGTQIDFDLD